MCLFGNEDFHVQMRLASIYFILKFESHFYELLCKTEGTVDSDSKPIQHIENIVSSIAANAWGCNVVMVALSMLVNRPLCYINGYDQVANPNYTSEDPDIQITYSETAAEPRFRVAYAFHSQVSTAPLTFFLYEQHYVSLASITSFVNVFDLTSISFFNPFNNIMLEDELFV